MFVFFPETLLFTAVNKQLGNWFIVTLQFLKYNSLLAIFNNFEIVFLWVGHLQLLSVKNHAAKYTDFSVYSLKLSLKWMKNELVLVWIHSTWAKMEKNAMWNILIMVNFIHKLYMKFTIIRIFYITYIYNGVFSEIQPC